MTLDANKQLIREHYDATTNQFDPEAIDRQIAPNFTDHSSPPDAGHGPEMVKAHMRRLHHAFGNLRISIEHILAEDDFVAVRGTWSGVHQAEWMGIPATGKTVTFSGIVMWRVFEGKITDRWGCLDGLGLVKQLHARSDK